MRRPDSLMHMPDGQPYNSPPELLERSMLWTVICGISALPSFVWAKMCDQPAFDTGAMITGVLIFIAIYTLVTGTQFVVRLQIRPSAARALRIGYLVRIFLSALFPLGMGVDLIPGMFSGMLVDSILQGWLATSVSGGTQVSFFVTLSITLVQGFFLNLIGFAFIGLVYLVLPRRTDEQMIGLCEKCGYDLRASYQFGRCPECGMPCVAPPGWKGLDPAPHTPGDRTENGMP